MSIPIIVLSTLTGTANFADSYVPVGFKQGFSACVGGLNIFCGILGTLMSFLKYAEIYEAHRIAALAWSSLGRSIQIELALKDERRKNCRDFLKVSRSQYDSLLESSPTLDQDVIATFNKKFADDYPHVSFPIVCNGLDSRAWKASGCLCRRVRKTLTTGSAGASGAVASFIDGQYKKHRAILGVTIGPCVTHHGSRTMSSGVTCLAKHVTPLLVPAAARCAATGR